MSGKGFLGNMTENLQADCVQSRQAGFIQRFPRYPDTDHSRGRNRHRQSRTKSRKISVQIFLQKGLTFFVGFGIIGVLSLLMPCMGEIQKEVY